MFEGFSRTEIKAGGARIVAVIGGKGPPLLLMHGNPFTHVSWHKIAPRLASEFTVIGHDRGARVLHRMCLDHPGKVQRAAILDIIPQHYLLNNITRAWGTFS